METSLILVIVGFLVVAYLIFKLIKKVVVAIITVFVVFILLVGGIVGLVYLDVNHLTSQQDFDVNLVYVSGEEYFFGVNLPIKNQEIVEEGVSKISSADLGALDVDSIEKDDGVFVVLVEDDVFEQLLTEESYDLAELGAADLSQYGDFDLVLSRDEVLNIVNSQDGLTSFLDILYEKNGVSGVLREATESIVRAEIQKMLDERNMSFRGMLFAVILSDSLNDEEAVLSLLEGYKDGSVVVEPDRISFKIFRMLPVDTVKEYAFPSEEVAE